MAARQKRGSEMLRWVGLMILWGVSLGALEVYAERADAAFFFKLGVRQASVLVWDIKKPSWLELEISNSGEMRIYNRMPGVGLPTTLTSVAVDIVDAEGRVLPGRRRVLIDESKGDFLSLFPGQQTQSWSLLDWLSANSLTGQERIWVQISSQQFR